MPRTALFYVTFLDVLVLVERLQRVVLREAAERVDQVGAQVRIDVLWGELCRAGSVHRPVRVVADDLALGDSWKMRVH